MNNITHNHTIQKPKSVTSPRPNVLDSSADKSWFAQQHQHADHADASAAMHENTQRDPAMFRKRDKSAFAEPIHIPTKCVHQWPMDSCEPPPFQPPWPSRQQRRAMERESSHRDPEAPLGPLATHWVNELGTWYENLQQHFDFNPNNLASNVRRSSARWRSRL